VRLLVLMFIALAIGMAHSWVHPVSVRPALVPANGGAQPGGEGPAGHRTEGPGGSPHMTTPDDPFAQFFISLDEARALYEEGNALWVDAREPEEFESGRIPGAFNISPTNANESLPQFLLFAVDRTAPVVIYCGGGDCHASEIAANMLLQSGYTNIKIMKDGFPAWQTAGYDAETPEGGG